MFAFVAEFISNEGPLTQKLKWLRMVGYIFMALSHKIVNECVHLCLKCFIVLFLDLVIILETILFPLIC
jgi:hypothetical protein